MKVRTPCCPDCGNHVRLLSTANVLEVAESSIVDSIVSRVKSDGGKYSKLVEVLCHGFSDNKTLRNIDDFYALSVLLKRDSKPVTFRPNRIVALPEHNKVSSLIKVALC